MPRAGSLGIWGLSAKDRKPEEKKEIEEQARPIQQQSQQQTLSQPQSQQPQPPQPAGIPNNVLQQQAAAQDTPRTPTDTLRAAIARENAEDDEYSKAKRKYDQFYGVGTKPNSNTEAGIELGKQLSREFSSYYKRFESDFSNGYITDAEYLNRAANFLAMKDAYGEQAAANDLNNFYKEKIGQEQQGVSGFANRMLLGTWNGVSQIEGSLLTFLGAKIGSDLAAVAAGINFLTGEKWEPLGIKYDKNLNPLENYVNALFDNDISRYSNDLQNAGANHLQDVLKFFGADLESAGERIDKMKASRTKYDQVGIGAHPIVTTAAEDNSMFSAATVPQAWESWGFTVASMNIGRILSRSGTYLFKGATSALRKQAKAQMQKGLLKEAAKTKAKLAAMSKARNLSEPLVIAGLTGTNEGALNALQTKIDVQNDGKISVDEAFNKRIDEETKELFEDPEKNPRVRKEEDGVTKFVPKYSYDEIREQVAKKYQKSYNESLQQVDYAASKAGAQDFYTNSLINGMLNATLKGALQAPRVRHALSNNRLTGWAFRGKPKYNADAKTKTVTPASSISSKIWHYAEEPIGEMIEEGGQTVSSTTWKGGAENNIAEFIDNKLNGDGLVKIGSDFSSDYGATWNAFTGSLTDKETWQSAILGGIGDVLGRPTIIGRNYHRDRNGNLVQSDYFSKENFKRGLDSKGNEESVTDYIARITPWSSGPFSAHFNGKKEDAAAEDEAKYLTEWLQDPKNQAKFDHLVGTTQWVEKMRQASAGNDEFGYRNSMMGLTINDAIMLQKLKGTDYYETVMTELKQQADLANESLLKQIGQAVRSESEQGDWKGMTDEEVGQRVKENSQKMLDVLDQVEKESDNIDSIFGRVDDDTRQSLIYGKIMEHDFTRRYELLDKKLKELANGITSSVEDSGYSMSPEMRKIVAQYGSVQKALHARTELTQRRDEIKAEIDKLSQKPKDEKREDGFKRKQELDDLKAERKAVEKQLDSLKELDKEENKSAYTAVLSEKEIMELDPVTRAIMLANGANKMYNLTHQDRQAIDQLSQELNEKLRQFNEIEATLKRWTDQNGKVRKGYNKKYANKQKQLDKLNQSIGDILGKRDELMGKADPKRIFSSAQQDVIDSLVRQGQSSNGRFLDDVIDMGRLYKGISDYYNQYADILADPNAFQNYVMRAKHNAKMDLIRRQAERLTDISKYEDFSRELSKLLANASQQEKMSIISVLDKDSRAKIKADMDLFGVLHDEDGKVVYDEKGNVVYDKNYKPKETFFNKYMLNKADQADVMNQFTKHPEMTENDQSLIQYALEYAESKGIGAADKENVISALTEANESGEVGGKFREWVEERNSKLPDNLRTHMPVFSTIGTIVNQYSDLVDGMKRDAVNKSNANPTITPADQQQQQQTTQQAQGSAVPPALPNGGAINSDGEGTPTTDAQAQLAREREKRKGNNDEDISEEEKLFRQFTTPEIARYMMTLYDHIDAIDAPADAKENAKKEFVDHFVNGHINQNDAIDVFSELVDSLNGWLHGIESLLSTDEDAYRPLFNIAKALYQTAKADEFKWNTGTRPTEQKRASAIMHTANIEGMRKVNPDAWAVQFSDEHKIDKWLADNPLQWRSTPVYFITDSEWSDAVREQMNANGEENYNESENMPLVIAVKVEAPADPSNATSIEVDGQWYQPIGVMPSSNASMKGSENNRAIREHASKEQGRHLVTEDGLPSGNPLRTKLNGANYLHAHHRDATNVKRDNSFQNDVNIEDSILNSLPENERIRLKNMGREEMLKDPAYQEARNKFVKGLKWDKDKKQTVYVPDRMRPNGSASPIQVHKVPISETKDRKTGKKKLKEVLEGENLDKIKEFNSRLERIVSEIFEGFYKHDPTYRRNPDRRAHVITKADLEQNQNAGQEAADEIAKTLNGIKGSDGKWNRGVGHFVYIGEKIKFAVYYSAADSVVGEDGNDSMSVYHVSLENDNDKNFRENVGAIQVGGKVETSANEQIAKLLRNLFIGNNGEIREGLVWQLPIGDLTDLESKDGNRRANAERNLKQMTDDGVLQLPSSSIAYDVDGVEIKSPFNVSGSVVYGGQSFANPDNAGPATPVAPAAEGATTDSGGHPVDPGSGADLSDDKKRPSDHKQPEESEKFKRAKKLAGKIAEDSKQFKLSDDEKYYYAVNQQTGQIEKYARVTSLIRADDNAESKYVPSTKEIYSRIKETHKELKELSAQELNEYKETKKFANALGITEAEVKRAAAELRTEHDKNSFGEWTTPSTSIGNAMDEITRDFLDGVEFPDVKQGSNGLFSFVGKDGKEMDWTGKYKNVDTHALAKFVNDLSLFRQSLDLAGITIVSNGIVAHGQITVTNEDGSERQVNVAGTLDLLGYDKDGNFYIFDMKTVRDHSAAKIKKESGKWSRQLSMYADLLTQQYGNDGFNITPDRMMIIPINVNYESPKNPKATGVFALVGAKYIEKDGQLYTVSKEGTEIPYKMSDVGGFGMRTTDYMELPRPGYSKPSIKYDNLNSEEQDIINDGVKPDEKKKPVSADVKTPTTKKPALIDEKMVEDTDTQQQAPPIQPAGSIDEIPILNTEDRWNVACDLFPDLNIYDKRAYLQLMSDPVKLALLKQEFNCKGI